MDKPMIAQSEHAAFLYDAPVRTPDQDRLHRAVFAGQVADSILKLNADEGFVFALNGAWGTGKTSIINLISHSIEQKKAGVTDIVVVRFNPWWFSGHEDLIQQFFRQLRAALGGVDSPVNLKRVGSTLDTLAKILTPLNHLAIPGASIVTEGMKNIGEALQTIGESQAEDVHGIRQRIDKALRDQQARILVVIDDIDRLPSDEIRHVFRLVKAVADFPKTIYLLSFDKRCVVEALDETCKGAGLDYLEKIVQVSFDVPSVDKVMLRRLFFENLEDVIKDTPSELFNQTDWGNVFWDGIDPFLSTPRQVKQLINCLRAIYPMVKGEVCVVDFIAIQTLRTFVPEAYTYVQQNKNLFAGAADDYGYGRRDDRDERLKQAETFLKTLQDAHRETVKNLFGRIFPLWGWLFGGSMYGADYLSDWRRVCRVCSPDVFERYFMFTLLPSDIGASEMRSVLSLASDRDSFATAIIRLSKERCPDNSTRLKAFWDRMQDYTRDLPQEHFLPIIETIYDIGDQVVDENNEGGMFEFGDAIQMGRIVYQLVKRLPTQDERCDLLAVAMTKGRSLCLIAQELTALGQQHGKFSEKENLKPEAERLVSSKGLERLEGVVLGKIHELEKDGRLSEVSELWRILCCWTTWETEEAPVNYVHKLIETDNGFITYIQSLLGKAHSHTITDRVVKTRWTLRCETATRFSSLTKEALVERSTRILKERFGQLAERQKTALETLIQDVARPADVF